jgi:redox-sensing transcriptional repressor
LPDVAVADTVKFMTNTTKAVPAPVLKRLTDYYATIQGLRAEGVEWVSSSEVADALGLTSSTVRQDLSHLNFAGVSKRGYETSGLETALARALGADKIWNMLVVGAGNLGRALALHQEFRRRGFVIRAVCDSDVFKTGLKLGRLEVQRMNHLPELVKEQAIDIGVIAVPGSAAQDVADLLVAAGVKGLLNLSSVHITVPEGVAVTDARIIASLQELTHAMMGT